MLFGQEHVDRYRETDGAEGYDWQNGTTILLLTTVGRKSGEERTSALIFRDWEDAQLVVASKGGEDRHPAWYHNLKANPDTTVQVASHHLPVHARVADPDERERLWPMAVKSYHGYADYAVRSKGREIPLVILEPR